MKVKCILASAGLLFAASSHAEETNIDYALTIAGLEIGDFAVKLNNLEDRYMLEVQGGYQILFFSGNTEGTIEGAKVGSKFDPVSYRVAFDGPSRASSTEINFAEGAPVDWSITPPPDEEMMADRTPIPEPSLNGAIDPITAFLINASSPMEACSAGLKVFSGFVRFDIQLTPDGPPQDGVAPCRVDYRPVAGHKLDENGEVKLLAGDDLTLSLFEMAPDIWAPHRIGFKTPVGTLAFERRAEGG